MFIGTDSMPFSKKVIKIFVNPEIKAHKRSAKTQFKNVFVFAKSPEIIVHN